MTNTGGSFDCVGTDQSAGPVLTLLNGTAYRLVVDDAGVLSTIAV